jgi:hypothetical protein
MIRRVTGLAEALARAVAAKDDAQLLDLLHPEVDFRGMTPGRVWEADRPAGVLDALHHWFGVRDDVEGLVPAGAMTDAGTFGPTTTAARR